MSKKNIFFIILLLAISPFVLLFYSLRTNNSKKNNTVVDADSAVNLESREDNKNSALDVNKIIFDELVNLGVIEFNKQNLQAALAFFLAAKNRIAVEIPIVFSNICASYNGLGNYEEAIVHCKKALALEPNFQLAKNNLVFAEEQLDKKNKK